MPPGARVEYMECPAFFEQAGEAWRAAIPAEWRRVEGFDPARERTIILYGSAMQLFPSFWGPVTAALALPRPAGRSEGAGRVALVPAEQSRLIAPEAARALADEGFEVRAVTPGDLVPVLEQCRPEIFLSINFAGLDPYGAAQAVLERAGVPVAVWCVDNPFHSLSGVKTNVWKNLHLFVTDSWFVEPLERHGAKSVHHLPLAANPDFFRARPDRPDLQDKLLFVGRSEFPDKKAFFAGITVPDEAWAEATSMLARGERPDFGWWASRLGVEKLWPGREARRPGYGAEQSGQAWRSMVIREAAQGGNLAVCGDEGWRSLVDAPFALLPPVDYYGPLAAMYASARYVVGAVSPLLPHGLTQRHFDVWAAGGCLLTDATPGLCIFPEELTRPVTYHTASEIPALACRLLSGRSGLIQAWRDLIEREHTYGHRIRSILEHIAS